MDVGLCGGYAVTLNGGQQCTRGKCQLKHEPHCRTVKPRAGCVGNVTVYRRRQCEGPRCCLSTHLRAVKARPLAA